MSSTEYDNQNRESTAAQTEQPHSQSAPPTPNLSSPTGPVSEGPPRQHFHVPQATPKETLLELATNEVGLLLSCHLLLEAIIKDKSEAIPPNQLTFVKGTRAKTPGSLNLIFNTESWASKQVVSDLGSLLGYNKAINILLDNVSNALSQSQKYTIIWVDDYMDPNVSMPVAPTMQEEGGFVAVQEVITGDKAE